MKTKQQTKEARELWEFAIHKHIGSFTLTQEQLAVEDIVAYLDRLKGRWRKEILEMIEKWWDRLDIKTGREIEELKQQIEEEK